MNAIVTGASRGIGRAIVTHLAANKFNVALCARNEGLLEEFAEELRNDYPDQDFFIKSVDLEDAAAVTGFAEFCEAKMGNAEVLINNAGLFIPSGLRTESFADLDRQMKVNLYAPYILSQFFARKMAAVGKGNIINICSVASYKTMTGSASYTISKTALLSLTRLLREEYTDSGIQVSAIMPGATFTESWSGTELPEDRFVSADDIAKAVLSCLQMSSGANIDEIIIRPRRGEV